MVIWVTGLSGSGKTSLCEALYRLLKPGLPELVLLDGDVIRSAFGDDLGHGEEDRRIQVKRLQNLARMLSQQGLVVMVAVLYCHPDLMRWNRQHIENYFEVYLKSSWETLRKRDRKGLYTKSDRGETANVVGIDIPWHPPAAPDLVMNTDTLESPETMARRVVAHVPQFASMFTTR